MTITIEEFRRVLADPQLVRSRVHRGEGTQAVPVDSLVALAQSRTQAEITVAEVDELISSLGGQRVNVTSLDHLFRRAARRVQGKTNPPADALYVLSDEAFPSGDRAAACARADQPGSGVTGAWRRPLTLSMAGALVLISGVVAVAPARARTLVVHQPGTPQATLTVPPGWRTEAHSRYLRVVRGRDRVAVRVCPLDREERDMTGRHFTALWGEAPQISRDLWGAGGVYLVPVAGGGCLVVSGRGGRSVAPRLRARLGPPGPPPRSDAAAERLARRARARTLGQARATGTAFALPFHYTTGVASAWEWDLPAHYSHQIQRVASAPAFRDEIVDDADGDHLLRSPRTCWTLTQPPAEDDALQPRLELQEWGVPPKSTSAWRIAYAPAEPQPDGSIRVRWSGFVADGEALIGADGLLRSVRIVDHHRAIGRTVWRVVQVDFTSFPSVITPVTPTPACA